MISWHCDLFSKLWCLCFVEDCDNPILFMYSFQFVLSCSTDILTLLGKWGFLLALPSPMIFLFISVNSLCANGLVNMSAIYCWVFTAVLQFFLAPHTLWSASLGCFIHSPEYCSLKWFGKEICQHVLSSAICDLYLIACSSLILFLVCLKSALSSWDGSQVGNWEGVLTYLYVHR